MFEDEGPGAVSMVTTRKRPGKLGFHASLQKPKKKRKTPKRKR